MCGLYGIVPMREVWTEQQEVRVASLFNTLAVLSDSRGGDAAGRAVIGQESNVDLYKQNKEAMELIDTPEWDVLAAMRRIVRVAMLMGHARLATCGTNISPNAHPFAFYNPELGRLVGTHNGCIRNHTFMGQHSVDSANLFKYLSESPDSEWVKNLRPVQGWYALAMYRRGFIYLVRDDSTPLAMAYSNTIKSWVYASTEAILRSALVHSGLDIETCGMIPRNRILRIPQLHNQALQIDLTGGDDD